MEEKMPARALSLRQPWAELVVRGKKTLEVRGKPTKNRGPVLVYAARNRMKEKELEQATCRTYGLDIDALPRGVIIGVVNIVGCRRVTPEDSPQACFKISEDDEDFGWVLEEARRFDTHLLPKGHPQPSFFFPFGKPQVE